MLHALPKHGAFFVLINGSELLKWKILLMTIVMLFSVASSTPETKESPLLDRYKGTWEASHLDITTTVILKDNSLATISFLLERHNDYVRYTGYWRVVDKFIEFRMDFVETTKFSYRYKEFEDYVKMKMTVVDDDIDKAIVIDHNASTYTVYKIKDKNDKEIKRKSKGL